MTKDWNAHRYAADFHFVADYGRSVTELLTVPVGSRVIDLGCGTGTLTAVLRQRGYRVLGIDASADMLAQARRRTPFFPTRFFTGSRITGRWCGIWRPICVRAVSWRLSLAVGAAARRCTVHWKRLLQKRD